MEKKIIIGKLREDEKGWWLRGVRRILSESVENHQKQMREYKKQV